MLYYSFAEGPCILCYGDSNTYGYDPATTGRYPAGVRYPTVLQSLLGSGFCVVEEGLPGRTSTFDYPAAEGMNGLATLLPILLSHAPLDTLVLMLGTNDFNDYFQAGPRLVASCLVRLVKKALATECWRDPARPDVLVVCPAPITHRYYSRYRQDPTITGCDVRSAGLAAELAPLLAPLAPVRFLDAGRLPGVQPSELDGMHLTPASHRALAEALANDLRTRYARHPVSGSRTVQTAQEV